MADVFKAIHPFKFFNDFINNKSRIDGRNFREARDVTINVRAIKNAEASAGIKIGNTTVVCGIKLELAIPKPEAPENGFLVINSEMPALCSQKIKPGPPNDFAQTVNSLVSDIILNCKCVDLKELCIQKDKLCWVVYCDMVCLDCDGSLVDAFVIAVMSALKTLYLPKVHYDCETEEFKVDPDDKTALTVTGLPLCTSFGVYSKDVILTDPTAYEEQMCGGMGSNCIICWNEEFMNGVYKFGGQPLTKDQMLEATNIAKRRIGIIEKAIDLAISNNCTHNKHFYD